MASIIRVKRSTGTTAPSTLNYGELALTVGSGTQGNKGDRFFVGNSAGDPIEIGGKYYTDLLQSVPGAVAGSSNPGTASNGFVAILDQNRKVDQWNVDNLTLDGNVLSSTDANGDILLDPNGTGDVVITGGSSQEFVINNGVSGTNKFAVESTTGNTNIVGLLTVTGGVSLGNLTLSGITTFTNTTDSTSTSTGAVQVLGGVGIAKSVNIGGDLGIEGGDVTSSNTSLNLFNSNVTTANVLGQSTTLAIGATSSTLTLRPLSVVGTNATQNLYDTSATTTVNAFGQASSVSVGATSSTLTLRPLSVVGTNATQNLYDTSATTTVNAFGQATTLAIGSTSATLTLRPATITGTNATQTLYDTSATTTVNAFGQATTLAIGATSATLTLRPATITGTNATQTLYDTSATTTVNAFGQATTLSVGSTSATLTLRPSNVVGTNATQNLYDTSATTTVNAFGQATTLAIGSTAGVYTLRPAVLVGSSSTQDVYNTVATGVRAFGSATSLVMGATTGVATIRNATLSVPNATTINLGATGSTTQVTFPSTPNDSFVSIAATSTASSTSTGALRVSGGVGIASDVHIGGTLNVSGTAAFTSGNVTITNNLTVNGNTTFGNQPTDTTTITGSLIHVGFASHIGGMTVDNIGISSNVISTRSGGGNQLFIDPFPDGLSNEGTVIIKGDLQVDGTTTTVNSSAVTINEALLTLGDVTSVRTVTEAVASGVSTIRLDSVIGINTGDTISGTSALPNAGVATVSSYDTNTKIVTVQGTTSAGIAITTQLTVNHAFDTNTDRGILFKYNTSSGTSNNKTGFFGYKDGTNVNSGAPIRSLTFIPDATVTNSVVTGTRGSLDIKNIFYQSGDFSTSGVAFFDSAGELKSTTAPAAGISTSNQILTVDSTGTPVWTTTIDGGTF